MKERRLIVKILKGYKDKTKEISVSKNGMCWTTLSELSIRDLRKIKREITKYLKNCKQ